MKGIISFWTSQKGHVGDNECSFCCLYSGRTWLNHWSLLITNFSFLLQIILSKIKIKFYRKTNKRLFDALHCIFKSE